MKLALQDLRTIHQVLRDRSSELAKYGALALQRAGHLSPVRAHIEHDDRIADASIEWQIQDLNVVLALDQNRITEDGAEAVAVCYAHGRGGWLVKRRLQRGEYADWLMQSNGQWLALEISGTVTGDAYARLRAKREQLSRCTLPAERWAVVIAFEQPKILAGGV
jgi:hypothetical protein